MTRKEAEQLAIEKAGISKEDLEEINCMIVRYYGKKDLVRQVLSLQPFYYDENKLWWIWDKIKFCWKLTDEVDIINIISTLADVNTVNIKEKNEIMEAMRQEARLKKPKHILPTWIQFNDEIVDIKDGSRFKASSEYFVTNPIPYKINGNPETPNMDRIFKEWVGEDYVQTLYEIISYCLLPSYMIHRLFCFIGSGMNGKSCFLNLLKKFIGDSNCTSTELDTLMLSRFEVTRLHKKLVCIMGETNFNEISKTSIIKKLTGGDFIGFEYKNKTPFEDYNYAKILIATNNLPETTDKSIGFYRRWLIIDFMNQFSERKDILSEIPEEEYNSLATKCIFILNELLERRSFSNEGSVEERMKRYEDKSNPFDKFIKENCNLDDPDGFIWKFEFEKNFNQWCKSNRFRLFSEKAIAAKMKDFGVDSIRKVAEWVSEGQNNRLRCWVGVKWKNNF